MYFVDTKSEKRGLKLYFKLYCDTMHICTFVFIIRAEMEGSESLNGKMSEYPNSLNKPIYHKNDKIHSRNYRNIF